VKNNDVDKIHEYNRMRDIYTISVKPGSEKRIIQLIKKNIEGTPFQDKIDNVFMKTQKSSYYRDGKIIEREKSLFPGYIFLQADLSFELHQIIGQLPGVISILTAIKHPAKPRKKKPAVKNDNDKVPVTKKVIKKQPETPKKLRKKTIRQQNIKKKPKKIKPSIRLKPQALTQDEVNRLLGISVIRGAGERNAQFIKGDSVKIISSPFKDFDGIVDKVNNAESTLTVNVAIFGRVIPVELSTDEVEKYS